MHYSLAPARSKSHKMLLECLAQCFQEEAVFAKDEGRLQKVRPICPD